MTEQAERRPSWASGLNLPDQWRYLLAVERSVCLQCARSTGVFLLCRECLEEWLLAPWVVRLTNEAESVCWDGVRRREYGDAEGDDGETGCADGEG